MTLAQALRWPSLGHPSITAGQVVAHAFWATPGHHTSAGQNRRSEGGGPSTSENRWATSTKPQVRGGGPRPTPTGGSWPGRPPGEAGAPSRHSDTYPTRIPSLKGIAA